MKKFKYIIYLKDHQGNNRVVLGKNDSIMQVNHYYPFGALFGESKDGGLQKYKYNGKELERMYELDLYDYGARWMDPILGRFTTPDPLCEKYYSVSPYAYCANNPIKYVDLKGDSLTLVGNFQETLKAIYNGLDENTNLNMRFINGVLDPSSIANQAKSTTDLFLQDIYEMAKNSKMVELSVSDKNIYNFNNQQIIEDFQIPLDVNTRDLGTQYEALLKLWDEPLGKSINRNLGQTLFPGNIAKSGKSSTNANVQIIINEKGSLNHRTVGMAHEFGHAILYLRGLPFGHGQPGVDKFVYNRATTMSKKLGYDY